MSKITGQWIWSVVTFFFDKTRLSNSGRSFEVQMYHSYTSVSNTGQQVTNNYTRYPGQKLSDLFFFFALLWREREQEGLTEVPCNVIPSSYANIFMYNKTVNNFSRYPLPWASSMGFITSQVLVPHMEFMYGHCCYYFL